jgi:hypothetical protein
MTKTKIQKKYFKMENEEEEDKDTLKEDKDTLKEDKDTLKEHTLKEHTLMKDTLSKDLLNPIVEKQMSKNQMKKLAKKLKREADLPIWREFKRNQQKEKRRIKREQKEAKESEIDADKDNATIADKDTLTKTDNSNKSSTMTYKQVKKRSEEIEQKYNVAIDMSFDDLMKQEEVSALARQIGRCYAANRRAFQPFKLFLTSFSGSSKSKFELSYRDMPKWQVNNKALVNIR